MMFRAKVATFICSLCLFWALCLGICNFSFAAEELAVEADQQISDFNIAGRGEKGKKEWDLSAKTADIFQEQVKLMDVKGNFYGKEEDVNLSAKKGDFNKEDGKVHLEQDVVIATSGGTELTTNSLDWDKKGEVITTDDIVNIKRENMIVKAIGAKGQPNLKQVVLKKDVRLDIEPAEKQEAQGADTKEKITITCDGLLEIDYEKNIAQFNNNVKVVREDSEISSDKMDVYFIPASKNSRRPETSNDLASSIQSRDSKEGTQFAGSKIDRIVAKGNVQIIRGENISYSEEAIYTASDKKVLLIGRPKLIIYSKDAFTGN